MIKADGLQRFLAFAGCALLVAAPVGRRWLRQRRSGSALVIFTPLPGWKPTWRVRANRFAGQDHARIHPINRDLLDDAKRWAEGVNDVQGIIDHLYQDAQDLEFDAEKTSVFISAPWCVAWAIGAPFEHYSNLRVYEQYPDHGQGFFVACDLRRDKKAEVSEGEWRLVRGSSEDLAQTSLSRAIVLKLGSHDLVPDALASARSLGVERVLRIEETYDTPGYLDPTTENFDRVSCEAFSAMKAFVDKERRASGHPELIFYVYASLPVSVAFVLGAFLGLGMFRLMHWDHASRKYVEAHFG